MITFTTPTTATTTGSNNNNDEDTTSSEVFAGFISSSFSSSCHHQHDHHHQEFYHDILQVDVVDDDDITAYNNNNEFKEWWKTMFGISIITATVIILYSFWVNSIRIVPPKLQTQMNNIYFLVVSHLSLLLGYYWLVYNNNNNINFSPPDFIDNDEETTTTKWICCLTMISLFLTTKPYIFSIKKYFQDKKQQQKEAIAHLLSYNDVWVSGGIFSFVSSNNKFVLMAATCHDLKNLVLQEKPIIIIFKRKDIWMNILSYVGPGHYIYVASVCNNFKTFYKAYFATITAIPMVRGVTGIDWRIRIGAVSTNTFYSAAFSSLDCLRYAHENGCRWDERTCAYAAHIGCLDGLRYAHENGCPWNELTCYTSARGGHFDCLQYARQNGCPWDSCVTAFAAGGGNLAVLKWLREQDHPCPWHVWTCNCALSTGNLHCFNYAIQNDCPPPPECDYEMAITVGARIIHEGGRRYLVLQEQEEDILQLQQLDDLSTFYETLLVAPPIAGREMIREALQDY